MEMKRFDCLRFNDNMIGFTNFLFRENISEAKMIAILSKPDDSTMKLKQKVETVCSINRMASRLILI